MRVLLCNPPTKLYLGGGRERYFVKAGSRWPHSGVKKRGERPRYLPFPFGLGYAAGVLLERGHDVRIVDGVAADLSAEGFLSAVQSASPEFVFLEVAAPTIEEDIRLIGELKNRLPGALLGAGGTHATAFAQELLTRRPELDFVFKHEYEFGLSEVVGRLKEGLSVAGIPGLVSRGTGGLIDGGPGRLIEALDELPRPARHLFPMDVRPNPAVYWDGFCQYGPALQMTASRGCPFGCSFCVWPQLAYCAPRHRVFSPERVVDEMKYLTRCYGAREIYFDDDNFNFDREHVLALCSEMDRRKIGVKWSCMCDAVHLDEGLIEKMAAAGCIGVKIGVESGSPRVLEGVGKPVDLEHVGRVARFCADNGIKTHAAFILGLPGEDAEDLRKTIDFAKSLEVDTIQVSSAAAFPGTTLSAKRLSPGMDPSLEIRDGKRGLMRKRVMREWLWSRLGKPGWLLRQSRYALRGIRSRGLGGFLRGVRSALADEMGSAPGEGRVIVAVHDSLDPLLGNGAVRTLKAAREFKKRGREVIVFGPSRSAEIDGLEVRPLPSPTRLRPQILGALWFNLRLIMKALPALPGAEVIFVHNAIAAVGLSLLNLFFRKRFVLDLTDVHTEYLRCEKTGLLEKALRPLLTRLEYAVIRFSADEIIVVSEAMRGHLTTHGVPQEMMKVVYDGADVTPRSGSRGDLRTGVIHLGAIDKQHGVDVLLRAAGGVLRNDPKTKFYFVGDGRERRSMEVLAKRLGVDRNCVFTGYLPHAQAKRYLEWAAVGVIPRPDLPANNMVVTLKLFEYWANHVPVVASRLKGIEEVAQEGRSVRYFAPGDHEDLSWKIRELLERRSLAASMADEAYRGMSRFSWEKLAGEIADSVVASDGPAGPPTARRLS